MVDQINDQDPYLPLTAVSGGRRVGNLYLFEYDDPELWEEAYQEIIDPKYAKQSRRFKKILSGEKWDGPGEPPIFIIPRIRAGPSYKSYSLQGVLATDLLYAPISKGYPMQEVPSFTLGPIVGEGLCLVNAAFSKMVCVMHISGGQVDLKRKNYWRPTRKREVERVGDHITVDGNGYPIIAWLEENKELWFSEWDRWRKSVALSSLGSFHWSGGSDCLTYYHNGRYLTFIEWKKECYIKPSYALLSKTDVFQYLQRIHHENRRPLGLVHPMGRGDEVLKPLTAELIAQLYEDPDYMACQPYVVAGKLLNVPCD